MSDLDERAAVNDYARRLIARFEELERDKRPGRGQANDWQALNEDALELLLDLRVPSAVTSLFSVLLGNVLVKSSDLSNRHAAELAAARLEALHEGDPLPVSRVAAEYDRVRNLGGGDSRKKIRELRKDDRYQAKIRAFRLERD